MFDWVPPRRQTLRLTVAEILRQYTPGFVVQYPRQAVPQVQSTLAKLSLCRTAALGGRTLKCESCGHQRVVYNSCGDRHGRSVEAPSEPFGWSRQSKLQLGDEYAASPSRDPFAALLVKLEAQPWAVYIQGPPKNNASPEHVLKYLARYMTGGPISDRRLIEVKRGRVYFGARSSDKSGRQVPVSLPTIEFIRRWTLHILPKGFTKARRYGGWSNTRREAYQKQCERLQPIPPAQPKQTSLTSWLIRQPHSRLAKLQCLIRSR